MKPKSGDTFYNIFKNDDIKETIECMIIIEVENEEIEDDYGNIGYTVLCDDSIWYDCFWSNKHQCFVYALAEDDRIEI